MAALTMTPIGVVSNTDAGTFVDIFRQYSDGLEGLEGFSHVHVFFWFHENDTQDQRRTLKVHPCKNPANPLTGVFATHSPLRPNLIGLTLCRIVAIDGNRIELDGLDARDGSPVVDIKCFIRSESYRENIRHPDWVSE